MKVGLCACFYNHNYGSMLQAFANEKAITVLGHECEMICYVKKYTPIQKIKQIPRIFNGGNFWGIINNIKQRFLAYRYPDIEKLRKERDICFDEFCKKNFLKRSPNFIGYENLKKGSRKYDAVMVGSDQLWLPTGLSTNYYNLQFVAEGIRRISYATSFGVSKIPWYQRKRTRNFLRKIDFLSVREAQAKKIVEKIADISAKLVVDPTLLFGKNEWDSFFAKKNIIKQPYIFCYFLGNNRRCREQANAISILKKLPIVVLKHMDTIIKEDDTFGSLAPYDIDPSGFVNLIRNADYVLTDSFHGSVFSIIYHKKFQTFYRFKEGVFSRNSRIDSLLGKLGLLDRINCTYNASVLDIDDPIDYEVVDCLLADWKKESWDFLRQSLE